MGKWMFQELCSPAVGKDAEGTPASQARTSEAHLSGWWIVFPNMSNSSSSALCVQMILMRWKLVDMAVDMVVVAEGRMC